MGKKKGLIDPSILITPQQAAEIKGVSRQAVYKALAEDRLPSVEIAGRVFLEKPVVIRWRPKTDT